MNKVTLKNVYGREKKYFLQPMKQKNGTNFPFVKKVRYNDNGDSEMILSPDELNDKRREFFIPEDAMIEVYSGRTFNLDDEYEKNLWECIKTNPVIAPERTAKDSNGVLLIDGTQERYGRADFYVEREGEVSQRRISRIQQVTKAYVFIENDTASGRITKCKLLGKSMRNVPDSDVQDYLYTRAEKNPQEIIDLYTGSDQALKLLIIEAKDKDIIRKESGIWMFSETMLGATDDAIVMYLKNPENQKVYDAIKDLAFPDMVKAGRKPAVTKK
ncbi:MAG: hypothetical protein KBT03_08935 [Bacteroidales bacterium]|nr:hypothetical protein [Candidatus Scybalousia scybalohippi]